MVEDLPLVESGAAECSAAALAFAAAEGITAADVGVEDSRLEQLKERIMMEIELKLKATEESMWRRGQVEIKRLQHEQQQVARTVTKLQERQTTLIDQNQKMRGAIYEVTSKFELVVSEMRQGIRALTSTQRDAASAAIGAGLAVASNLGMGGTTMSPSPSVASTATSEVAEQQQTSEATPGASTATPGAEAWSGEKLRSQLQAPAKDGAPVVTMWHARGPVGGAASSLGAGAALGEPAAAGCGYGGLGFGAAEDPLAADSMTFCTPPRASTGAASGEGSGDGHLLGLDVGGSASITPGSAGSMGVKLPPPMPPPSWQPSNVTVPASPSPAVLSLASALIQEEQPPTTFASTATPAASAAALAGAAASGLALTPSPGLKRLALAECLDRNDPGALRPAEPSPFAPVGQMPNVTSPSPAKNFDFATVELIKEPGFVTLGMEVQMTDGGSLRVDSIDDHGLVGRHNARQDSEATRIWVGDRLIEVNGVRGDPERMLQECKSRQRVLFTIRRRPHGKYEASGEDPAASTTSGSAEVDVTTASTTGVSPLPAWQLRQDAPVFVPSSRKEPAARATPPPPGLQLMQMGAYAVEPTVSTAAVVASGPLAGGGPSSGGVVATDAAPCADPQEVVKCLFH